MATNKQDVLARAYAKLKAQRERIGQMTDYTVREIYVRDYHSALDKLEGIGRDVAEYRIPDSALKPCPTASLYVGGKKIFSGKEEMCVERSFILTQLDAILGYFEIITSEKPRKIGFSR